MFAEGAVIPSPNILPVIALSGQAMIAIAGPIMLSQKDASVYSNKMWANPVFFGFILKIGSFGFLNSRITDIPTRSCHNNNKNPRRNI